MPTLPATVRELDLPSQLLPQPQPPQGHINRIYPTARQLNTVSINRHQIDKSDIAKKNQRLGCHQLSDIDLQEFQSALSLSPILTASAFNVFNKKTHRNMDAVFLSSLGDSVKCIPTSTASSHAVQVLMSPTELRRSSGLPFLEKSGFTKLASFGASASQTTPLDEIPADYYESYAPNANVFAGDYKIYWQLTELFVKRLQNIGNVAKPCPKFKMNVNKSKTVITNIEKLESQVVRRLECLRSTVNIDRIHLQNAVDKMRQRNCHDDIDSLIKIIESGYRHGNRVSRNLSSRSISRSQMLGHLKPNSVRVRVGRIGRSGRTDNTLQKKSIGNEFGQQLTHLELMRKDDEMSMLKQQVASMNEKMLHAQEEVKRKNEMIKELQNDLRIGCTQVSKSHVHAFLLQILKFLSGKF
ncbi:hypothetical protein GQX74_008197 [Glossina fuscipes]|nr:hypothetical protein GQX74_008197 [Glossina fuscipes]